ncbi:MAG: prepilin-type N-terminal cleavage/methylation domain-containing protein [Fibrobacter sp.]|nr:prepilin-type N-terminal cleavage/methylation domain-containing protein [Fibrobacter sp.]
MQTIRQDSRGREKPMHTLRGAQGKRGVTLIELLTVIAIMGILSGLGVAGLRSAVANARIKDAAYNVTAFMERTANEARRLNTTLCVVKETDQKLVTYQAACTEANKTGSKTGLTKIDELTLESPNKILGNSEFNNITALGGTNLVGTGAEFKPRTGLSAAPYQGFFAMQYGTNTDLRSAAAKVKTKNSFVPKLGFSNAWSDL